MASLNKVFLLGNLTRDPDFRGLPSGQSVCTLGLAVSRRFTNNNGQEQEETCFVDVSVWGKAANNCRQYLSKGSQVMVEGRLRFESWEDRNGGGRRSKLSVIAENVQFMNRRSREENTDGGNYGAPQDNYAPGGNAGNGYPSGGYSNNGYSGNGGFQNAPGQYPGSGMSDNGYRNSAPPMPEANYGRPGDAAPAMPEDDIPF